MSSPLIRVAAALALVPALASAQSSAAPKRIQLAGVKVQPGVWKYAIRANAGGTSRDIGTRVVTVKSSAYKGTPAWLITEVQTTPGMTATDSLYVSKSDLSGVHRVAVYAGPQGDSKLTMVFASDSVRASVSGAGQPQAMVLPRRIGSAATWTVVEVALHSRPLSANYRGVVDVLATLPTGFVPVDLTVTGQERVSVPGGSFDSWVVQVKSESGDHTHYVSKSGTVVRSVMKPPQMNGGTLETVLTSSPGGS